MWNIEEVAFCILEAMWKRIEGRKDGTIGKGICKDSRVLISKGYILKEGGTCQVGYPSSSYSS